MTIPTFTMRQLLEAGIHFGHHTRRWNPKMEEFIFGDRNNIHIINLEKTVPMLHTALEIIHEIAKKGGKILFVGTKRSASEIVASSALNCGQFYVNHRWLGGMLTNWETVSKSIKRLKELESKIESGEINNLTKKEKLNIERSKEKLELNLGGIKNMPDLPDAIFVVDINKEAIAVQEAKKLNIPVIAICDTNTDPSNIDYPVPGNDDAVRSISLYCDLIGSAILSGMEENLTESGIDIGEEDLNVDEDLPDDSEIESMQDANQKETDETGNDKKVDESLENSSNSN
ncbi:30S ribosomal protein S2 [Alphaproteobacteria bacterium]|nr:30S ribosomal protein S2 [Alphaproteobacteria bacterium]